MRLIKVGFIVAVVFTLLWLAACGGQQPLPTATVLPSQTPPPLPSATITVTASPSATPSPTHTSTPLPPTFTPTPVPIAERIPIVEYHYSGFRLSDQVMMKPEWFKEQMKWLADNHFTTLSTAEVVRFLNGDDFPLRSVALTFDLGTAQRSDFANVIIPTLKQYGLKAIFFLLVNDSVVRDECGLKVDTFCWQELRQWQDDGVVSFGSHGLYHPDYTKLSADEMRYDAGQAKKIMEQKLGQPVLGFTYPYDSSNKTAVAVVKSLGYQFATSGNVRADLTMHRLDQDRYELPRLYPYSNPALYPVLNGSNGKTFPQLILNALQEHVVVAAETVPTQGTSTPSASSSIVVFCHANPQAKGDDWASRLDANAFPSDLSPAAQKQLPVGVVVRPTCNFYVGNLPHAIIIHYTDGGTLDGAVSTFRAAYGTSAHYIIDRNGAVVQMVPETLIAFHVSCTGFRGNCVPSCPICDSMDGRLVEPYTQSIGIELVNNGKVDPNVFKGPIYEDYLMAFGYRYWEDYPQAQIDALRVLVKDIRARYNIPWEMVMGHYRINTKVDPGPALNLFWPRYGYPPQPAIFDTSQP